MSDNPVAATPTPASPEPAPPPFPFRPLPAEPAGQIGDPVTARAIASAEAMLARGADRGRVIAALQADGIDPELLDSRSPAQRAHDAAHGLLAYVDPASYSFPLGNVPNIENVGALNRDVRELASSLALPGDRGNSFCQLVVAAVAGATQHTDIPAVEAQTARNVQIIKTAFGERYDAAAALVNELLDAAAKEHPNQKLIAQLRPGGHACTPNMFGRLHAHATTVRHWADTAPK